MATAQQPRGIIAARRPGNNVDYPYPVQHSHVGFIVGEVLVFIGAIVLALVVKGHPAPLPGDVQATLTWQHGILPHRTLSLAIEDLSTINWPIPSTIGVALIEIILLVLRRWWDAIVSLGVAALGDGSSFLMNQVVQRPRPHGQGVVIVRKIADYFSFPSGHVVHALAFAGIVLFLTYRTRWSAWWLWIIRIALLVFIVMMGPSRVLEGEHWPSDVVEGLLVGGFWLLVGIHVYAWGARRWPHLLGRSESHAVLTDTGGVRALR